MIATRSTVPIFFSVDGVSSVIPLRMSVEIHSAAAVLAILMTMPMRGSSHARSCRGDPLRRADELEFQRGRGQAGEPYRSPAGHPDPVGAGAGPPFLTLPPAQGGSRH